MTIRPTLLDGSGGSCMMEMIAARGIETHDPVWAFNMHYPDLVESLYKQYIEAGSEVILANTFGANRLSVGHFSDYDPADVVREGVRIGRAAVNGSVIGGNGPGAGHKAQLWLDIGALTKLLKPAGRKDSPRWMSHEECEDIFAQQIGAGAKEGVDGILLETFMDLAMMEIGVKVARRYDVPVYCMMTYEKNHRTMMGNTVEQVVNTLAPYGISGVGMNCSLGPAESVGVIEEYHQVTDLPLLFKPNAGKPIIDAEGNSSQPYSPEQFVEECRPAFDIVSYIGGCCGTSPAYIKALSAALDD